ncbi:MAG: ribosome maturation factor RimP [Candidatus Omnitrophica bacterium]|nr:ribosome maturation factor RimP [Candidatus Omnitrophota bacterium]
MDKNIELAQTLETLIGGFLLEQGMVLVELIYRREGRDMVVRVLADWPEGGITLGECTRLNSQIGALLEEANIIPDRYILEVSSPGLDRSLRTKNDFMRCLHKPVRFFLSEPVQGKIELAGLVTCVDDASVTISQGDVSIAIPLTKINKAKQILDL